MQRNEWRKLHKILDDFTLGCGFMIEIGCQNEKVLAEIERQNKTIVLSLSGGESREH